MFELIAAGVAVVAGVVGALIKAGQDAEARKLLQAAQERWGKLELPDLEAPDAADYYIEKSDVA